MAIIFLLDNLLFCLPYILNKDKYSFIVDADIWGEIQPVKCNSDRGGYFIYQSDIKILL